jgi:cytochrome c oxidase assembly protein subunit 15
LLALVFGQVVVGAWFRHFKTIPALWAHIGLATAVLGLAGALFANVARRKADVRVLWPSALALGLCVTLQVLLGAGALWLMLPLGGNPRTPTLWQAMLRTGHQTNGALLLGASVVIALRAFRHLAPLTSDLVPTWPARQPETAPRTMEVVA